MGWLDRLMGRGKRAAGEATDSPSLREEGRHQESAGRAAEQAESHEDMALEAGERAAEERAEQDRINPSPARTEPERGTAPSDALSSVCRST
jgi:uncharacterized protein YjbJ (UPF0337 family)